MTPRYLALALSGDVTGHGVLCPGPQHSSKDRSLSVTPSASAPDGFVVFSHSGDDPIVCKDYVRAKLGMAPFKGGRKMPRHAPERVPAAAPEEPNRNIDLALKIWQQGVSIRGTLAEKYLASRAIAFDPGEDLTRVLRFHLACPFGAECAPALLGLMRDVLTDEPRCIQRTFLSPAGEKISRMMLGPAKGAAIKIDADSDVTQGLSIGEGLETCLSARAMGLRPIWAVGSAGAIATFPVLAAIDGLHICAEDDKTNRKAVDGCAAAWTAAGRDVIIVEARHGI